MNSSPQGAGPGPPSRKRRNRIIALGAVGAVVLASIIYGVITDSQKPTPTAAQPTATTASTPPAAPTTATTAATSVPAQSPPSSQAPPPPVALTGYAATLDAWEATHKPDPDFAPGTVYNPDPSLPKVNGHTGAKYTTVFPLGGRVTNYTVNFAPTSLEGAQAIIAGELPPDAHILWTNRVGTCVQVEYGSATVHAALGNTEVGDALAEYSDVRPDGTSTPGPTRFNQVLLSNLPGAQPDPSASC